MASGDMHLVRVRLGRGRPPLQTAEIESTGDTLTFGLPGWQAEHRGLAPGEAPRPGPLDHLVAAIGVDHLGALADALAARGIEADGEALGAAAEGEVVVDPDGVLRVRRIRIAYTLRAPEAVHAAAERAHEHHARHSPCARSLAGAIDILTVLRVVPAPEGAGVT
ncbi:MAG: OsmC family protein [Thermoleophilia bacterium]|jgi:hypothetical protein|nr:OsmC family protein [Thermoleophilia bacterium]